MPELLTGTEVTARGLRWELAYTQNLGSQVLHRLRGIDGHFAGQEIDLLEPFDEIIPVARELRPDRPAFTQKHDPYWNIPLNENLPQLVIDLRIPQTGTLKEDSPQYPGELFEFQTTSIPSSSGALLTQQAVMKRPPKSGSKRKT
jgi:hypothetical protein